MAKKFVADPEKRRRRQEELSRIAGVPIEPATEAEAAAFNTRIGQIERAPKLDVTTTEADAKPEVADVQAPEVAPVTDESPEPQIEARESMLQGDQPASLPEEPLVASGDLVESDEPVVPKAMALFAKAVE